MHELAVTQGILDVVLDAAQKANAARVRTIDLVIGDLTSIVDDSVQFYFDLLSRSTPAEGATLRFQREPGKAACLDCGHRFDAQPPLARLCPACGGFSVQITGGREFRVESIEVDDAAPA